MVDVNPGTVVNPQLARPNQKLTQRHADALHMAASALQGLEHSDGAVIEGLRVASAAIAAGVDPARFDRELARTDLHRGVERLPAEDVNKPRTLGQMLDYAVNTLSDPALAEHYDKTSVEKVEAVVAELSALRIQVDLGAQQLEPVRQDHARPQGFQIT